MRRNRLRELLNADRPSLGTHVHSPWPTVMELVGISGMYDYVEYVSEYAPYDLHTFENLARAIELYDMSSMIKVEQEPRRTLLRGQSAPAFRMYCSRTCVRFRTRASA